MKILADPEFDVNIDVSAEMDEIIERVEWLDHPVVAKYALKDRRAAEWAYCYAKGIIKGRWPEGEEVIKKDPEWAYIYARDIIWGRWFEGEEAIRKSSYWAYRYARDIIRRGWLGGEEAIKKDPYWWERYKKWAYSRNRL